ncbi:MAG: DNA-binding protein [Thermotogae bacterium]|nr:MAG: DNA-binding protein [Thermotogota bacterium]
MRNEVVLLTVQEAARLLRLAPAVVRRAAREGRLPGAVKVGREWRFRLHDLVDWIEKGGDLRREEERQDEA